MPFALKLLGAHSLGQCQLCSESSPLISSKLGACAKCIIERPDEALEITNRVHSSSREMFGLPSSPPRDPDGVSCGMCSNDCRIGVDGKGFCGLVFNVESRLVRIGGTPPKGVLQWYYDPLPTNCVAWWFCPGCTGAGYPKYANKPKAERGHSNLAVFYGACSYDCLFCQNWHYRKLAAEHQPIMSAESLASKIDSHVSCICFFGGDPSVQMPHAIRTSQIALQQAHAGKRILRVCWETNGYWKEEFAMKAAQLSNNSGGNIKFDLKTWDENLNLALCGVSNAPTLEMFKLLGERFFEQRPELPILTASTLLVPGYVYSEEISNIARFIAEVNVEIPYSLLAFSPEYVMADLPPTSRRQANRCYEAAKKHLENVRVGNISLIK